jgi:hypothetical protein
LNAGFNKIAGSSPREKDLQAAWRRLGVDRLDGPLESFFTPPKGEAA